MIPYRRALSMPQMVYKNPMHKRRPVRPSCGLADAEETLSFRSYITTYHLLLTRLPHIRLNRRTKRRESRTPQRRSLRSRVPRQNSPRHTPRRDSIANVILGAQSLDSTLDPTKQSPDFPEVLG